MIKTNDVLSYYKEKASFAEQISEPFQQQIIKEWLILLSKRNTINSWQVLDFGSGLGCNLITLKKFIKKITACDVNKTALNLAQKNIVMKILLMFYLMVKNYLLKIRVLI